ncbi:maleylacetoacetate isomerase [Rhodobacter aestuarii]|uniref:Maleylacetoacetate isomerase n=1 Tax=Rhodobacter aestuarii TaxID=453582 RepID=A0A1N7J005_9RHOB|nr:maleylacetoacetate isomerase [Rhodobacter aestuarii]PTV97344.1 maleylacetoacetate isomerase [Rhodobacter aestuarii]SIS42551.1 maleylacetoacetate isomerase [Rhodobacter aestuarii]
MIKVHGYFRSSSAYRLRIALNLKGVKTDFTSVHLRKDGGQQKTPAFRALNPQALVPVVQEGDFRLTQSLAIIEWLDETQPGPKLMPEDPNLRAQVRAFAQVIACDVHPLQNLRVLDYLKANFEADQAALDAWCGRWIRDGLAACEALLEQGPEHPFCFGDHPSLADICLVPQVFSAARFGVDIADLQRINRISSACEALPAFAQAHPKNQPDRED